MRNLQQGSEREWKKIIQETNKLPSRFVTFTLNKCESKYCEVTQVKDMMPLNTVSKAGFKVKLLNEWWSQTLILKLCKA